MKISSEFKEFFENPENVEKFISTMERKFDRKNKNTQRIKKFYNNQESFNCLVNKIIEKHNEEYRDRCYKKGYEPHPLNILYSLFDLSELEGEQIKPFDDFTLNFPSIVFDYMDWQFAVTHGQGSVCSVYYKKELKYID